MHCRLPACCSGPAPALFSRPCRKPAPQDPGNAKVGKIPPATRRSPPSPFLEDKDPPLFIRQRNAGRPDIERINGKGRIHPCVPGESENAVHEWAISLFLSMCPRRNVDNHRVTQTENGSDLIKNGPAISDCLNSGENVKIR